MMPPPLRAPSSAARASLAVLPVAALAVVALAAPPSAKRPVATPERLQYNRDIRPILSDNCFPCHGPDRNKRAAGLRLDLRDAALAQGAIIPGRPEKSKLVSRILTNDADLVMPPGSAHKTLTPEQKATLRRWVAEGAVYEAHWAYIVPKRPTVPKVRAASWVRNPVDAFVLARLEKERIAPSPEADRRTLIRRVSLDLTGLPPTPGEVEAFVADKRPDAYERLVDRLLASPHYGERMAVPWLDAARYADTVGFHGDQNQNAWAYRDYVIDAFNRNKPYDRFVVEQVAGDLLPNPTPAQLAATCFNRMNMMTREGGAQAKEYLAKYAADRVRTVSMAFLGSTFGCAECHDHKYDPISQKDFYSLAAFFADVQQWGIYADYGYTPNPDLKGYNNDSPFPPEVTVESPYLARRIARQRERMARVASETGGTLKRDTAAKAAYDAWRADASAFLAKRADGWETPAPEVKPVTAAAKAGAKAPEPPTVHAETDGRVLVSGAAGGVEITLRPETARVAAVRVEVLPQAGSFFRAGMDAGTLTLSAALRGSDGKVTPVTFRHAAADLYEPRYANGFEMVGVQRGWKLSAARKAEPHTAVWLPAAPPRLAAGEALTVTLPNLPAACVRVSVSPLTPPEPGLAALSPAYLTTLRESLAKSEPDSAALRAYLMGTGWDAPAFASAKAAEADLLACRGGKTPVLVTRSVKPATVRVLPRGNWQDDSGPVVAPNVPHFLPGYNADPGRRLSRLDLANWLVSPQNPLTSRVFVNRVWRQFFGNGLSGQVEDLGAQGEWPTHPELLDWLAVDFRERGWDVKRLVRLIVTSSAYRQSSKLRRELRDRDPNNRLLASQNPRRLEAEFVRDNALAVAGLLDPEVGGPPAKPYQPAGYYANIQFPDRDYVADADERQWRRGVYMHWQRTFLHPMLANFDAPSREDALCTRTAANTPQQALTLLNDPEFVEAARVFAADLLKTPGTDAARLDRAYRRALARPPKPRETASLMAFLQKVRAEYHARPEDAKKLLAVGVAPVSTTADPVELAAWASVCRVLLNLHETITRY